MRLAYPNEPIRCVYWSVKDRRGWLHDALSKQRNFSCKTKTMNNLCSQGCPQRLWRSHRNVKLRIITSFEKHESWFKNCYLKSTLQQTLHSFSRTVAVCKVIWTSFKHVLLYQIAQRSIFERCWAGRVVVDVKLSIVSCSTATNICVGKCDVRGETATHVYGNILKYLKYRGFCLCIRRNHWNNAKVITWPWHVPYIGFLSAGVMSDSKKISTQPTMSLLEAKKKWYMIQ